MVDQDGTMSLVYGWIDGACDERESFRFTITVAAVDRAGNVGPASEPFVIEDPGSEATSCAVGRGHHRPVGQTELVVLGLAGLAGALRRTRSSRTHSSRAASQGRPGRAPS